MEQLMSADTFWIHEQVERLWVVQVPSRFLDAVHQAQVPQKCWDWAALIWPLPRWSISLSAFYHSGGEALAATRYLGLDQWRHSWRTCRGFGFVFRGTFFLTSLIHYDIDPRLSFEASICISKKKLWGLSSSARLSEPRILPVASWSFFLVSFEKWRI